MPEGWWAQYLFSLIALLFVAQYLLSISSQGSFRLSVLAGGRHFKMSVIVFSLCVTVFALAGYVTSIHPAIPQEFGGGASRCAQIESKGTLITDASDQGEVEIWQAGSQSVWYRFPNATTTYEIQRRVVDSIEYC